MSNDVWLPKGYTLDNGSIIRSLSFSGDRWQIFDTRESGRILVARSDLAAKWKNEGFLEDSQISEIIFGTESFFVLSSPKKFSLVPVENEKSSPKTTTDAISFALALKESRRISEAVSFHDAIYVERFSRLLPTWTLSPRLEDEVVLGTWITGGVSISTNSFRRLSTLTGWMPTEDLVEILKTAGLEVPAISDILSKKKPAIRTRTENEIGTRRDSKSGQSQANQMLRRFGLPGRPHLEEFFNEHVIDIIFNVEKYRPLGIEFPSAIVLHGPPGCGKTFAVERLIEFIDWPSFSINSNSVGSPYIHETSKKISEVFDKAIDSAPSVLVIDEMESFLSSRRSGGASGLHHIEEVSEFLRRIPEALSKKVLIFAMTNMIDLVDPAILRRGRFDHIIEVMMPTKIEVISLLDSLLSRIPKSDKLVLDKIVDALDGRALSDSAFVVREGARLAARAGKKAIDEESLIAALRNLPVDKSTKNRNIGFLKD